MFFSSTKTKIPQIEKKTINTFNNSILCMLLLFFSSCFSRPEKLNEFEKVIEHYKNGEPDDLKLKAALYLIANIKYHQANYYTDMAFHKVFATIGNREVPEAVQKKAWETSSIEFESFDYEKIELRADSEIVTAEFLIDNIDQAFKAWRTYPWSKNLSFDDFKNIFSPTGYPTNRSKNAENVFKNGMPGLSTVWESQQV